MSKTNTEQNKLKIRKLSRNLETLPPLSSKSLQEVVGGITPTIPIPPP